MKIFLKFIFIILINIFVSVSNHNQKDKIAYKPGLHIISEFSVEDSTLLLNMELIRIFFNKKIKELNLTKIGEVYYQFPNSGYTAVVCLTESHISIHTWPEFNKVTFDIFLSNFLKFNNNLVEQFHNDLLNYMQATNVSITKLNR